ncbi:MAG TPA: enoyl-CoA hydratase-related protein, partial [Metabacillus sp.]|nr:enoyl-CoA hydratase-related protein [Metabacillus sp.]
MKYLQIQKENLVAVVTIHHEPANSLSTNVLKELSDLLDDILEANDVRAIILHGEGRFFSAGADIKEFVGLAKGN